MKKLILFSLLFLICSTSYSQNGWVIQSTPFSNINDMQFLSSQTGFIAGNGGGQIAMTSNGGSTWTLRNVAINQPLLSMSFINENTGWVCCKKDTMGYYASDVYKTSNGGLNWILVNHLGYTEYFSDIHLLSKDSAIITTIGQGMFFNSIGSVNYTFNGAAPFNPGLGNECYGLKFLNKNTGWVLRWSATDLGGQDAWISKTTNSGKNWVDIYNDHRNGTYIPKQIANVFFINENTGFLSGDQGRFAKTTNGGINWTDRNTNSSYKFSSLYFFDENTGYSTASLYSNAADSSALKRTTNGGVSWIPMRNNALDRLKKITFVDNLTGWAIGLSGSIGGQLMKTVTGGLTAIEPISSIIPDKFSLFQNFPNPFNPATKINYDIKISGNVSLKVYDAIGNEIETLVNEKQNGGSYSVSFNAANYPSGVYFYKITEGSFSETRKMIFLK